jgi:hypothetical protein
MQSCFRMVDTPIESRRDHDSQWKLPIYQRYCAFQQLHMFQNFAHRETVCWKERYRTCRWRLAADALPSAYMYTACDDRSRRPRVQPNLATKVVMVAVLTTQ